VLLPLEAKAETALLRLFRNTRSVRWLRRAIETVVAVSVRHVPARSTELFGNDDDEHRGKRENAPAAGRHQNGVMR
jgi:hypothetical protein